MTVIKSGYMLGELVGGKIASTALASAAPSASGCVDFVTDCGADPTGVDDIAPALDRAFVLLSALATNPKRVANAVRLCIPPGLFALRSAPATTVWNFNALATELIVQGSGDASMIEFHGFDFPQIANVYRAYAFDVTLVGAGNASSNDCTVGMTFNTFESGVLERVKIFNLLAGTACIALQGGLWSVRDCSVGSSGAVAKACFWANQILKLEFSDCYCSDISKLNGYTGSITNKNAGNSGWLLFDGNVTPPSQVAGIVIQRCLFDEGAIFGVALAGSVFAPIGYVKIEATYFNPPIHANAEACIVVTAVDALLIHGVIDSGFTTTTPAAAALLFSVDETHIEHLHVNPLALSNFVTADAGCGSISVLHSDDLVVTSSAQGTVRTPSGWTAPNDWNVQL